MSDDIRARRPSERTQFIRFTGAVRIISGEFRGRKLTSPKGEATRPMLDRVREDMFSSLGAVADHALFAGTVSLGPEALRF